MSTRGTLVIIHKKSCEIISVKHGRDLAEEWLGGSMSPRQLDALRDRAKELSTIPFPDGMLFDYYYVVTDDSVVKELNSLGTDWIGQNEDSEIIIFLKYDENGDCYNLFIHRTLFADEEEIEPDVSCLGT